MSVCEDECLSLSTHICSRGLIVRMSVRMRERMRVGMSARIISGRMSAYHLAHTHVQKAGVNHSRGLIVRMSERISVRISERMNVRVSVRMTARMNERMSVTVYHCAHTHVQKEGVNHSRGLIVSFPINCASLVQWGLHDNFLIVSETE